MALAQVFWSSAQTHLANWQTTLFLFDTDYRLPFLPPVLAAYMAVAVELVVPALLLLGLATRFATLVIFGMTLVIEIFVYPAGLAHAYPMGGDDAGADGLWRRPAVARLADPALGRRSCGAASGQ